MTGKKLNKVWILLLVLLSLVCTYYIGDYIILSINRLRAYNTEAYMIRINSILALEQPSAVDTTAFRELLRRNHAENYFLDGWGHPFIIESWRGKTNRFNHYRVISLGRSGKRSSCCAKSLVHHWDLNIVMEDGDWVQR